jgi:hypothetical protein
VREVHPIALEDVLHLEIIKVGVGKDVTAAPENTILLVVLYGALQQLIQSVSLYR